jgi:8-oxo-dGTP diphosphatase
METRTDVVPSASRAGQEQRGSARPNLRITTVVFSFDGAKLRVLAVKSASDRESYVLPSLEYTDTDDLVSLARQVISSRLPLDLGPFFQVGAFDNATEASRATEKIIEICYFTTASPNDFEFVATGSFPMYRFLEAEEQLELFESHAVTLAQAALMELRRKARFDSVAFDFLSHDFSLSELQRVFEAILNRTMDVRNFRKKIEALEILNESPHRPRGMAYRPPRMFSFDKARFRHRQDSEGEVRFF